MERTKRLSGAPQHGDQLFASAFPLLSPSMLSPRRRSAGAPLPFSDPAVRYCYLARNGICALARLWKLAGREVLFPSYFHGVEVETLRAAGVRLRFYPVRRGMRVNVEEVVSRINSRTRAVYLIHYLGFPGPVRELAEVCHQRDLLLIEDCALALLSCLGEKPLGSWGDASIFCLYKSLPVPNGGALVLRRGHLSDLPEEIPPPWSSWFASVARSLDRHFCIHGHTWRRKLLEMMRRPGKMTARSLKSECVEVGTDHFNPLHAGLGMSRLSHWVIAAQDFSAIVAKRRRNYMHLLEQLQGIAEPVFHALPPGVCPLSYPLLVEDKSAAVEQFLTRGVEAVNMWFPTHPMGPQEAFPETDELRRKVLELPCHQDLTPADVDRVARVAREVLGQSPQLSRSFTDVIQRNSA